jgi:Putative prokaryotic signal transducing protein
VDTTRLAVVANEMEAEMIRGLLETERIFAFYKHTDVSAGREVGTGPFEVWVSEDDLQRARELLNEMG